ncbi:GNAT family N-acetyltransferase [Dactylosporangium aurantiacum]|uniref:GNAT family N-acetyltransferase n=1 Tax=Dactylosporangium aurantiacum TaxID=35754 RepID=A0A9Q9IJ31_9ACTN|nr:GNAT family protein [Dactylosporangium aurantiacum]MDG6100871.1 GNAT family protein [Dactylosporangium aurantiacum]UWZ55070.1 GNAT family N-acetyltransferase [Dactylosporangium aurantiacum]
MQFTIRAVRADDWPLVKELRLAALQDPVAPIAFLDTYDRSVAQPDSFWQGRTADAAEGRTVRQFIGEDGAGRWLGSVTVLVEPAGVQDYFGHTPEVAQTHVVGVFVRPEARGTGLAAALFEAALAWSWELSEPKVDRVRLYVHEDNARAQAMYAKAGFRRSGVAVDAAAGREFEYAIERG